MTSTAKGSGSTETVGLSTSGLSQSRRKMLDLVNKLYNTGCVCHFDLHVFCRKRLRSVQVDLSLPQIVAIGSQSSGKSSLIEGMSGVALPRAAGTCTRSASTRSIGSRYVLIYLSKVPHRVPSY